MCSNRLFILSSFGKLEVATQTNKRVRERVNSHKNANYAQGSRGNGSAVAYTAILPDETAESAVEFLRFAVITARGIRIERVLADIGARMDAP